MIETSNIDMVSQKKSFSDPIKRCLLSARRWGCTLNRQRWRGRGGTDPVSCTGKTGERKRVESWGEALLAGVGGKGVSRELPPGRSSECNEKSNRGSSRGSSHGKSARTQWVQERGNFEDPAQRQCRA